MIDMIGWQTAGGMIVAAVVIHVAFLTRAYIGHRTRLAVERERSARARARATVLAQMVTAARFSVRMSERDHDGQRVLEVGTPTRRDRGAR